MEIMIRLRLILLGIILVVLVGLLTMVTLVTLPQGLALVQVSLLLSPAILFLVLPRESSQHIYALAMLLLNT
jgi:hypothetical protein